MRLPSALRPAQGLSNYAITFVDGGLTVNKAALTITANSTTKTYGNNVAFNGTEFSHSSLYNGDTISSVVLSSAGAAAAANASATPYTIAASGVLGTGLNNYTIAYAAGGLNVNRAALEVTAYDVVKSYGATYNFTGTEFATSGLLDSDSAAHAILSSPGAAGTADRGAYAIAISNAAGNGLDNYNITYVNGVMTIPTATGPIVAPPPTVVSTGDVPNTVQITSQSPSTQNIIAGSLSGLSQNLSGFNIAALENRSDRTLEPVKRMHGLIEIDPSLLEEIAYNPFLR